MCLYKRKIFNRYDYRSYYVNCGRCEACQQEKAMRRSSRIRNSMPEDGSQIALFVTLTYRNECIPYIRFSELPSEIDSFSDIPFHVNVYRDSSVRWVNSKYGLRRKTEYKPTLLTTAFVPSNFFPDNDFQSLHNGNDDNIGVLYYRDFQNYIKRLRQNLLRKYKYEESFSYFCCGEYGPSTCRPHFHAVFFVPQGDYNLWKNALSEAWSFDDYYRTRKNISIARDCASYVSSYVNCSASVPRLLKYDAFKPMHHYSQGFGMGKEHLSFQKVFEAVARRDLHFDCVTSRNQTLSVDRLLLPQYAIRRYFPKFKGFGRLTVDEVFSVFQRPESIRNYSERLDLSLEDIHNIIVCLNHKIDFAVSQGVSRYDYSLAASQVWNIYKSNLLGDMYDSMAHFTDNFYLYDNISELYSSVVGNDSLEDLMLFLPRDFEFIIDPNFFPSNRIRDRTFRQLYEFYSKDKRTRNIVMSALGVHV